MSRSFFEFGDTYIEEKSEVNEIKEEVKHEAEDILKKYNNMDRSQLLSNLYAEANKQKLQGTFDAEKLEKSVDNLASFLTPEQMKNIKEMIRKL